MTSKPLEKQRLNAMQAEKGDTFKLFKNSNGSVDYAMLVAKDSETGTDSFDTA